MYTHCIKIVASQNYAGKPPWIRLTRLYRKWCDANNIAPVPPSAKIHPFHEDGAVLLVGTPEEEIRELSRLEIPYRKADRVIQTETLDKIRDILTRDDLQKRLDSYFCHTINALENAMNQLKPNAAACIFVGNPRIDGITVELWRILAEYFTERGFVFEKVYEDRIQTRKLFGARKNKNPDGMKSEFLLILRKHAIDQSSPRQCGPALEDKERPLHAPQKSPNNDAS